MPLTIVQYTPQHRDAVLALFDAALTAEPSYLPQVSSGAVSLSAWFDAKRPTWARVACDGDELVGHVSVRRNHKLPSGMPVPADLAWELCRLAVAPGWRRVGVASSLVGAASGVFGAPLWATCVTGSAGHRLLGALGWVGFDTVSWEDDPAPGVALRRRGVVAQVPAA